jgi:hypothetical protein
MFSVYEGDFTKYIRDFIATIGGAFNGVVALAEAGDAVSVLLSRCPCLAKRR